MHALRSSVLPLGIPSRLYSANFVLPSYSSGFPSTVASLRPHRCSKVLSSHLHHHRNHSDSQKNPPAIFSPLHFNLSSQLFCLFCFIFLCQHSHAGESTSCLNLRDYIDNQKKVIPGAGSAAFELRNNCSQVNNVGF